MTRSVIVSILWTLHFIAGVSAATFRDDRGIEHSWDDTLKAKVGVRAGIGAVSLYHTGMRSDQLTATWGLWGVRGSDFDPENPTAPSIYPEADPSPEEAAFLASATNLSPSCWKNPRGCFRWDNITDLLNMRNDIDFVLMIDNASSGHLDAEGGNGILAAEEAGIKVIFVDTFYEYSPSCRASDYSIIDSTACYGRSMIDIAKRIEELAIFLGVDVDQAALNQQKQFLCAEAESFTAAMKDLHERGIRVKVSILGTDQDPETGASFAVARDFDPIQLWVPRTLEELGMPILHAGEPGNIKSDDYFIDCSPGQVNQTCNSNTYFPVDFWLIDSRSFLLIDDNFKLIFPDRAMLANQYWSYPRNDGSVSYVMIESLLKEYRIRMSGAQNVQQETKTCTPIDPKAISLLVADGTGGLGLNDFVCYDEELIQEEYLKCPSSAAGPTPPTAPTPASPSPPATPTPPSPTPASIPASNESSAPKLFLPNIFVTLLVLAVVVP